MKKHTKISLFKKFICSLFLVLIIFSCSKQKYVQNFDDIFDISGVQTLNQHIENISSADELTAIFRNSTYQVPKEIAKIDLDDLIDHYSKMIQISSQEVDMLLKNDSKTYIEVINRIGSLPPQISDLKLEFDAVKKSELNKYLLKQKAETDNFYSDDYYSAVMAFQKYINEEIIEPAVNLKSSVITIPPGNGDVDPDPETEIAFYIIIALNNNWDMWWTYWTDGTRTKHKGAAGSFPGE